MFRVLVPTDFSEVAPLVLRTALAVAADRSPSEVTLLHVQEGTPPPDEDRLGVLEPERLMSMMKMLQTQYAIQADIPIEEVVVYGQPVEAIVEEADKRNVDVIVMGTHGRSKLAHLLMGSVSEGVMRAAKCPVLTLRAPS